MENMYAGTLGKGASDATYGIAIYLEFLRLHDSDFAGASADIYKCSDELQRSLIKAILKTAGMPDKVRVPYMNYVNSFTIFKTIAGYMGQEYTKNAGMPQGDPLSMLVVALVMRAWVVQMTTLGVEPRILADDLLIVAAEDTGDLNLYNGERPPCPEQSEMGESKCDSSKHLRRLLDAYDTTHKHPQDIGAEISLEKCYTFASTTKNRDWLKKHIWRRLGEKVSVLLHIRDFGTHLSTSKVGIGTTLTKRLDKATNSIKRLKYVKTDLRAKTKAILAKILNAALYGCEAPFVAEIPLAKLRSAIVDTIITTTSRRSLDLTYSTCLGPVDLDPEASIYQKPFTTLRRYIEPTRRPHGWLRRYMRRTAEGANPKPHTTQTHSLQGNPDLGAGPAQGTYVHRLDPSDYSSKLLTYEPRISTETVIFSAQDTLPSTCSTNPIKKYYPTPTVS